jgi:hypothetical protein
MADDVVDSSVERLVSADDEAAVGQQLHQLCEFVAFQPTVEAPDPRFLIALVAEQGTGESARQRQQQVVEDLAILYR